MEGITRESYSAVTVCQPQILQIPIKEDIIVPDAKEDVGRILQCTAVYRPGEESLEKRRLRFRGELEFTVLYREDTEKGRIHSLRNTVAVEDSLNLEGIAGEEEKLRVQMNYEVENIRATLLNSRKISLGALLEAEARISRCTETSVIAGSTDEELQLCRTKETVSCPTGEVQENRIVRETVAVKEGEPNIAELLWWDSRIKGRRCRLLEDRIEVRGEMEIGILYRDTEDAIQFRSVSVPFTGSADCPGAREGQLARVQLHIVKSYIRTAQDDDGEERLFETEIVMEMRAQVFEERERELVTDAYHIRKDVELVCPPCSLQHFVYCAESSLEIIRSLEIPEGLPDAEQVFYTVGRAHVDDCTVTEDQVLVEGVLYVTVFYRTAPERGLVAAFTEPIPFSKNLNAPGMKEGQYFRADAWVETIQGTPSGTRTLELRAGLLIDGCGMEEKRLPVLTELNVSEADAQNLEELPSAALCFIEPGESLWEIAKRLHIRPDQLESVNDFTVLAIR